MSGDFETSFETERGERAGKAERLDVIPLSNGNRGWTPAAKARRDRRVRPLYRGLAGEQDGACQLCAGCP